MVSLLDDQSGERFPPAGRSRVGMLSTGTPTTSAEVGVGVVLHDIEGRPMAALRLSPHEAVETSVMLFRTAIRLQDCIEREKAQSLVVRVLAQIIVQITENAARAANPVSKSESLFPGSSVIVD
jgi:hypothetical protein